MAANRDIADRTIENRAPGQRPVLTAGLALLCGSLGGPALPPSRRQSRATNSTSKPSNKAIDYLRTKGQAADGSFSPQVGPAVTAIVVTGLVRNGRSLEDPLVRKGLEYLDRLRPRRRRHLCRGLADQELRNLRGADGLCRGQRRPSLRQNHQRRRRLHSRLAGRGAQGGAGRTSRYGGVGYGGSTRPDLSNTAFLIDALKAAGAGPDDKAIQEALVFVSRCQNLESEHNTTELAAKNPDGGFYYTPLAGKGPDAGKDRQWRAAQLRLDDLLGTEEHDLRRRRRRTTSA